jgi:hypothetical protein
VGLTKKLTYDTQEIFDLNIAYRYLHEGYAIRHINWPQDTYIYYNEDEDSYEDELGDYFSKIKLDSIKDRRFKLVEEDICEQGKMEESGTQVDGEHKNKLNLGELETKNENVNETKSKPNHQKRENVDYLDRERHTTLTQKNLTEKEMKEEKETYKTQEENNENGMLTIRPNSLPRSNREEEKMTPLSDSLNYYNNLETEKSDSITLLNDSAQQLMKLTKDIVNNNKGNHPIETELAIKSLSEVRSIMKTKLDFLKFGKEIVDGFDNQQK